ncbi:DUF2520 domain-containing protein [Ornithinibacillus sp. BX22]|uniref:DUF2520 domain-containing protein n=2 Tax=Ornithinibacillus TaxID=484508 RepID=A0A923RJN6_9BACI|nr:MULTISPECIES: Rossmann-like and DUF2520 domain-containing protein [Ornithinibacillus]MBC5637553.1 DUF2520 domain-containing protein [Ornithinibacillus hominis]MBS3679421.1 DUF2520 domain-containing protein [Ornithinibacillus massiliensis]
MQLPQIGFIGAGKVGITLGKYFSEYNIPIFGYYSKTKASSNHAALITRSRSVTLQEVVQNSDLLFLTVPDSALPGVWEQIRQFPLEGKEVCHCSGTLSSSVFQDIEKWRALGFSLHPLCAIHDINTSYLSMQGVHFTLEGAKGGNHIHKLLSKLANPIEHIAPENKILYHAAAVFCSNLVIGLTKMGTDLFLASGLSESFAQKAWRTLFEQNAQNVVQMGLLASLTGPIERGDETTVKSHLHTLQGPHRQIYEVLSKELLELAKQKHPERDYSKLEEEMLI